MATVDTIRNITIKATDGGTVDALASKLNDLADAQTNVGQSGASMATVTDTSASKQLSAGSAYDKLRTSIDSQYKSQQQLAKGESVLTGALNQGVITTAQYAQMHDLLTAKYGTNTTLSQAFGNAIGGVQTQMVALSAGMGPVGVFLASFGPWGLAAAAGVGLITGAIEYMVSEANRMGDVAIQLRNVSEATGLSTDNLQKLDLAGADAGLSADQTTKSFERFEVQLGSLRDGTGTLYTDLMKVNPALVTQMASTKDAATAWNLLAQAYAQADQQQQVLIAHAAAGGRNGTAGAGNLLAATNSAGGIQGLQTPADLLSQQQIDDWAKLKTQIDAAHQAYQNIVASMTAGDVLRALKDAADETVKWAQAMKDVGNNIPLTTTLSNFGEFPAPMVNALNGGGTTGVGVAAPLASATAGAGSGGYSGPNPQFMAEQWKAYTAALGPAATLTDQFNQKWAELSARFAAGGMSIETYDRALAGLQLQTQISQTSALVSALGPLAPVQLLVSQAMEKIQADQEKGISFTTQQIAGMQALAMANAEWTKANDAAAAGILDVGNATKATSDQMKAWTAPGGPVDPNNPTQMAAALAVLNARYVDLQNKVANATPAEKALNDALYQQQTMFLSVGDAAAAAAAHQINPLNWTSELGSSAAQMAAFNANLKQAADLGGDFANAFGQAMLQGKTATQALNSALNSLASSLISMISKQLVNQALGSLIGALGGGLGGSTGGGKIEVSAMGNVFDRGMIHPFALGGIVSDIVVKPTLFPMANGAGLMGEAGPEAVMPLTRMSGGQLGVRANGGGGGGGTQVINTITIENNTSSPATQTQSQNSSGGTDTRITIGAMMNERVGSGALDKVMKARFGVTPVTQAR